MTPREKYLQQFPDDERCLDQYPAVSYGLVVAATFQSEDPDFNSIRLELGPTFFVNNYGNEHRKLMEDYTREELNRCRYLVRRIVELSETFNLCTERYFISASYRDNDHFELDSTWIDQESGDVSPRTETWVSKDFLEVWGTRTTISCTRWLRQVSDHDDDSRGREIVQNFIACLLELESDAAENAWLAHTRGY